MSFVSCIHSTWFFPTAFGVGFSCHASAHFISSTFPPGIPFLSFADKLLVVPFDLLQIIIGKLAPLLLQLAFEMGLFSLELSSVHRIILLCKTLIPQLHIGVRSSRLEIARLPTGPQ